jgi:hypothetical protein
MRLFRAVLSDYKATLGFFGRLIRQGGLLFFARESAGRSRSATKGRGSRVCGGGRGDRTPVCRGRLHVTGFRDQRLTTRPSLHGATAKLAETQGIEPWNAGIADIYCLAGSCITSLPRLRKLTVPALHSPDEWPLCARYSFRLPPGSCRR